jgi:hypothetical protein
VSPKSLPPNSCRDHSISSVEIIVTTKLILLRRLPNILHLKCDQEAERTLGGAVEVGVFSNPNLNCYNLDNNAYVFSLRAFGALRYAELYFLAFIQGFVATRVIDLLKVYENIGA